MDSDAEADIEPTNYVTISQDVKAGIGDFVLVKFGEKNIFFMSVELRMSIWTR